jgi:23S rRNA pseudouridine2605 synthase
VALERTAAVERLQKYLASRGVASRRAAEQLISAGRVEVNGRVVTRLGTQVEPTDRVEVDGSLVEPAAGNVYLALNKTPGTVATTSDPWRRPTVVDLVAGPGRLFPVGRLDADSEGLLLLTNDGELANRLMHPRYGCEKEYLVLVRGRPTAERLEQLRAGVELAEGLTAPALVELADTAPNGRRWVRVVLREGRKRQVRRMLGVVGLTVERLLRVRIGSLELGSLPPGKSRPLTRAEVAALKAVAGVGS